MFDQAALAMHKKNYSLVNIDSETQFLKFFILSVKMQFVGIFAYNSEITPFYFLTKIKGSYQKSVDEKNFLRTSTFL